MIEARVKESHTQSRFRCNAVEYVKSEWRSVPPEHELHVEREDELELQDVEMSEIPASVGVNANKNAIKLAESRGLSVAGITGSGKDGKVTLKDVEAHIAMLDEAIDNLELPPADSENTEE
jgi:hypothetical protein